MSTEHDVRAARDELSAAIAEWMRVKAAFREEGPDEYDTTVTDDPIIQGWIVIAAYTSIELEREEATATAYECGDGQPAPLSRGLATYGVDRWSNT
ncbi:hypothetical protein [Herbiconiux sp. UC225_62]|uniref:hypothetical protein n=1 Tax=Herbiconiux sp. UC225_62 TaxID=3350168 RepID=UPI0036D333F8